MGTNPEQSLASSANKGLVAYNAEGEYSMPHQSEGPKRPSGLGKWSLKEQPTREHKRLQPWPVCRQEP